MLSECVAAYGNHAGKRMLVKNRDKSYKPTLDFYHEVREGTEVLYYVDEAVKHLEGMNEHGVGVIYTTSNFQKDDADMISDNIDTVLDSLSKETAREAAGPVLSLKGGVHGLVYISGPDGTYLVEHNANTGEAKVQKLNLKDAWNVTTNSPTMLAGGIDASEGENYISSQIRKAVAEAALHGIDNVEEALEALSYKYFDEDSHHNPLRNSEFETTCAQIGMDLDGGKCFFTAVPGALEGSSFKSDLPDDYSPRLEFVKRQYSEPTLAPFRLFTTKIDEGIHKFNLVNYLLDDGPEKDPEKLDGKFKSKIEKASRMQLAQKAADELWEKERILVSLVRKLESDPVFFTAGHTSTQVQNELDLLHKMIKKIGEDYKELLNVIHIERYGDPMPMLFDESKRKPRKKGQHKGSSSHSDLYTDEDPKGTIHGLGFKDAATAKKGVAIVNKAKRDHAHKVQATLVMQQRAKVAKKRAKDPEKKKNLGAAEKIWTSHLEKLKKKTKKMNESALREYIREQLRESRFKQMSKSKFTDLKQALASSTFLDADPEGDMDDDTWSSEAAVVLRNTLNDYFDSKFQPGEITSIVKVDMMPTSVTAGKDSVLKGATYYFEDGLHFIEVMLANIEDGSTLRDVGRADQKVYEVIMHELLHMQQFLKFSRGKPTEESWAAFKDKYQKAGGAVGMGEDYFFFDDPEGPSELETFSFQIANELEDALGKTKAVESLSAANIDLSTLRSSSASFRDIEKRSDVNRPEMADMLKRAKQYIKRM